MLASAAGDWAIAPGYSVKWSTTGDAAGIFKGLAGTIHFDEANLNTASFNVSIDVASLNTGNGLMNTHAKSAEWLDATKYPKISFVSAKVVKAGAGYQAIGNLTMHGATKPLTLPFTFQHTGSGGLFHATFTVNRTQFGVGKPGDVDDNISIELSVPVTKQ
ncbi:polyisoprenoid-binding protein YceI [Dinghuibacter silviterrae]|uniref:Polyisoprenoid-binding protein YceI n=2 Tax=Dinghuibacter silviterrae TaxID=1539049 RepID=A0A4V6QA01_9BACT|nr:polyisoprenoid-binding protein YceI [Dinghuibacter silviterrae]